VLEAANDNIPAHGSLHALDANNKKKEKKTPSTGHAVSGCGDVLFSVGWLGAW